MADPNNPTSVLCFLGPNGCGKTTMVKDLERCGAIRMTTSALLEEARLAGDPDAKTIDHYKNVLKQNVPCEIPYRIAMSRLEPMLRGGHYAGRLFALDGLGRGRRQIELVTAHLHRLRDAGMSLIEGYVFLTLSFEETKRRVNARVAEALEKGEEIRPEDVDGVWQARYHKYSELEDELHETASHVSGRVIHYNLDEVSTDRAAAELLKMVTGHHSVEELHRAIIEKRRLACVA